MSPPRTAASGTEPTLSTSARPPRALPPGQQVAWLLRRLDLARRANEQPADLGAADLRLLWLLSDARPRTLADIAHELGLEQSTVNRQVRAALEQGLVRRYPDPGQAARLLAATAQGQARFDAAVRHITGAYDEALRGLDPAARTQFIDALGTFVERYEGLTRST